MSRRSVSSVTVPAQSVVIPKNILAGLRVELDPKDVALSGSLVTQFNNTNGVGGACVSAGSANATLNATDANFSNQPSASFSGNSAATGMWYGLPDLSALTQGEAFVVLNCTYSYPGPTTPPNSTYTSLWHVGNTAAPTSYTISPSSCFDSFGTTARKASGATGKNVNVPHIYNVSSAAGAYSMWRSQVSATPFFSTATNTVQFPATPRFGASYDAAVCFNGQLAYLAICDQVQTAAARARMLSYLGNRFGIALP